MQDFMKTITSAIRHWTTAKIKNSTADWNEKDVNKDSYIKNKPDVVLRKEVDAIQNIIDYKMNKDNPVGIGSFSMNRKEDTEIGDSSHAEGYSTVASGDSSHAEGYSTVAGGGASHAEGYSTVASVDYSHAEGYYTKASGNFSHAEGNYTEASGSSSHAEGYSTVAGGDYSHVQGKCNKKDTENIYAHIVGNGVSNNKRSNAHTLDWEGNAWFAGDVYTGSTSGTNMDEGSKKLQVESDDSLSTTDKTIVGAINEVNTIASELNAKYTEGTDSLILLSPNGTKFNITVGDDGALSATEIMS